MAWLSDYYDFVSVGAFVVMPNHVHAIIEIRVPFGTNAPRSLSQLVGAYKTRVSARIRSAGLQHFAWHRSFHDHIIRSNASYNAIADYIENNPTQWHEDRYFKTSHGWNLSRWPDLAGHPFPLIQPEVDAALGLRTETPRSSAVERESEIIGEAMSRIEKVDPTINISSKKQIINMRNRVIHGYDKIDNEIVWGTIVRHLPKLKEEIDQLLR